MQDKKLTITKQIIEKLAGKSSVIDEIKYGKVSFLIQAGKVVTTEYTQTEK